MAEIYLHTLEFGLVQQDNNLFAFSEGQLSLSTWFLAN